jgi:hypothetical protein
MFFKPYKIQNRSGGFFYLAKLASTNIWQGLVGEKPKALINSKLPKMSI